MRCFSSSQWSNNLTRLKQPHTSLLSASNHLNNLMGKGESQPGAQSTGPEWMCSCHSNWKGPHKHVLSGAPSNLGSPQPYFWGKECLQHECLKTQGCFSLCLRRNSRREMHSFLEQLSTELILHKVQADLPQEGGSHRKECIIWSLPFFWGQWRKLQSVLERVLQSSWKGDSNKVCYEK